MDSSIAPLLCASSVVRVSWFLLLPPAGHGRRAGHGSHSRAVTAFCREGQAACACILLGKAWSLARERGASYSVDRNFF